MFYENFKKISDLLTPSEKKQAILLFLLILIMAFVDMLGVASIFPFISVLADPELIEKNDYLNFFLNLQMIWGKYKKRFYFFAWINFFYIFNIFFNNKGTNTIYSS